MSDWGGWGRGFWNRCLPPSASAQTSMTGFQNVILHSKREPTESLCLRSHIIRQGSPITIELTPPPGGVKYANYWAPLTRKRHTMPHSAQSQHANYWAPRTRKRHQQQEHRPQRPTESSDPTQHAKGRTGDRPGPRKGATTRRNVTQGGVTVSGSTAAAQSHVEARSSRRPMELILPPQLTCGVQFDCVVLWLCSAHAHCTTSMVRLSWRGEGVRQLGDTRGS